MYIIIEIQANDGGVAIVTPIPTFSNENIALQAYYTAVAAAAVSSVQLHTILLLNESGATIRFEQFDRRSHSEDE